MLFKLKPIQARTSDMIRRFQILLILFIFFTIRGYGYIDPGTGSYIIQILIAAVVGAGLGVRLFWKRIKDFFNNLFGKKKEEEIATETPANDGE
jgi:hypothetical protein